MRKIGLAIACSISFANVALAESMTFTLSGNGGNYRGSEWIAAEGTITEKTPDDFEAFLANHKAQPNMSDLDGKETVIFNSSGGNVMAGIKLARAIKAHQFTTDVGRTVPDGYGWHKTVAGRCDSACEYAIGRRTLPPVVVAIAPLSAPVPAPASVAPAPPINADEPCTVANATGREIRSASNRIADADRVMTPVLLEQLQIIAPVKDSDKPLKDLLPAETLAKYVQLHARVLKGQIYSAIESARRRDATVAAAMSVEAWKAYQDKTTAGPMQRISERLRRCTQDEIASLQCKLVSEDKPGELIYVMRAMFSELPDITTPAPSASCNVAFAVQQDVIKATAFPALQNFTQNGAQALFRLRAKYGTNAEGRLNTTNMITADQQIVERSRLEGNAAQPVLDLLNHLRNIQYFWQASTLIYQSGLEGLSAQEIAGQPLTMEGFKRVVEDKLRTVPEAVRLFWSTVDNTIPSQP